METFATWISENPYIAAGGLLATFLGLIIAIITPIVQRRKKQLHYTVSTTPLVEEKISNIDNLEILFSGEKIQKLSITNIKIWNGGNSLIDQGDVYPEHELVLRTDKDGDMILGVDIIKQSSDTIQCNIDVSSNGANITFQTFEKKDYVLLNIYHTGDANTCFKLHGKIKECKILDKTIDINEIISIASSLASVSSATLVHKALTGIAVSIISVITGLTMLFRRKKK